VIVATKKKLRSTPLTVAVLVVFFLDFVLPTLLRLVLAALAALLALFTLSGLAALLALSALVTLLPLLLHVVSHKTFLLRKRGLSRAFGIYRLA
jgi:fatty acid desaturase